MAPHSDTGAENGDSKGKGSSGDEVFMMECLKHLQTPATIDINAVAKALGYKNSASVANRVRVLKKKYDIEIICSQGPASGSTGAGGVSATPSRKGAKAARRPIAVKPEADDEEGAEVKEHPAKAKKPAAKRGRKPKAVKSEAEADGDDDTAAANGNGDGVGEEGGIEDTP
ncbi:hypothetical protein FQN55_001073 [Onygenales sp. PD_40]|nr:hypothetical protein FQN55_001073 [Onygenales sp. PD_40]KAK2789319.1 hypothetical protein FQN53_002161 [Emmonsiellopsis sp. PD_33]KAK2800749.1 hypothetical protein FQN51_005889 [Onygenales sp. PD_10]